jgi:hypothetical protein
LCNQNGPRIWYVDENAANADRIFYSFHTIWNNKAKEVVAPDGQENTTFLVLEMANIINNSYLNTNDALFASILGDHVFKDNIVIGNDHLVKVSPDYGTPTFEGCYFCCNGFETEHAEVCNPTHPLIHIDGSIPGFHTRKFTDIDFFRRQHLMRSFRFYNIGG